MDDKKYSLLKKSEIRSEAPTEAEKASIEVATKGRRNFLKGAVGAGAAATAIGKMAPKKAFGKISTAQEHYDLTFKKSNEDCLAACPYCGVVFCSNESKYH